MADYEEALASDYDEALAAVRDAISAAAQARDRAATAVDRAVRARADADGLRRIRKSGDETLAAAVRAARRAEAEAGTARAASAAATERERAAIGVFGRLADPREQAGRLPDDLPLLLMPVRLETRFTDDDLLVRVFPDVWAVDGFEPRLSGVEVDSGGRYWAAVWRTGGTRDGRLTAWRGLVGSHGSGRAAWIVQEYRPVNPGDAPTKADPHDVILVVTSTAPLPAADRAAAATYWAAVWRADGAATATTAAETALTAALGEAGAARVRSQPPGNLTENPPAPLRRADVTVSVAFLDLPSAADVDARRSSWTRPPRVNLLPDRFVLLGFAGGAEVLHEIGAPVPATLAVGPDPSAPPDDQLRIDHGELKIPDELRWMVDFETAVTQGMGFRVPLDDLTRGGLDRLFVLGLRLRADAEQNGADLATLIDHHLRSRAGFALVPQGTPTNNTERTGAGFDRLDNPDASFVDWFERPDFRVTTGDVSGDDAAGDGVSGDDAASDDVAGGDWRARRDGQWLAEWLGIDPAVLLHAGHADATDQREARAMNTALWPATWGYFLETMLAPVTGSADLDAVRAFFVEHVSGRGAVPAIRIGRQPYGILPTTAFSRLTWESAEGSAISPPAGLDRLDALLRVPAADWQALSAGVGHLDRPGDAHRMLLDLLGLHPASVEFHQRYAESVEDLFNRYNLDGFGGALVAALVALGLRRRGMDLLARFGYDGAAGEPDILNRLFLGHQNELTGPLIDDRPLSETAPVRAYTTDGRNYLSWLVDAARTSLETLRREDGFIADMPPTALLYLMLRHALQLSWWDTSLRLRVAARVFDGADLVAARREAPFVHVSAAQRAGTESRWRHLYAAEPAVTGNPDLLLADYIPAVLATPPADRHPAARHLSEQIEAIDLLRDVPTARLERLLAEHLDCAAYRLDAWRLGLVHARLAAMRYRPGGGTDDKNGNGDGNGNGNGNGKGDGPGVRRGVHLGAYGWLENVRPKLGRLAPVELDGELAEVFNPPGSAPLMRDPANGGYVHAPSLNHAATAAILRAGYLANAAPEVPGAMAVNLSSRRVREALAIIEGIRNGQSLGALLGYRLERGLHDDHDLAEVDEFIYVLRKAFPLRADRLPDTATGPEVPIGRVEARNVVDGLELVRHVSAPGNRDYPYAVDGLPTPGSPAATVIAAEVDRLLDAHDALADLALAEGVHQAVLGNTDRVAATLDAYSKAGFPPEPAVVATPRSGTTLLHRIALHLTPGLDPTVLPVAGVPMNPSANAEPAVNDWLARLLPAPADVACRVRWTDPATGTAHTLTVTQADLGLQPVDLLFVLRLPDEAGMTELDDRVIRRVLAAVGVRPDTEPRIHYTEPIPGKVTFFALAALVERLRSMLLRSRALRPTDLDPHSEADRNADGAVSAHRSRVALVVTGLQTLRTVLDGYRTDLGGLLADPVANRPALLAGSDTYVDRLVAALATAARYGVPQAGWGPLVEWRRATYAAVLAAVAEVVTRWTGNLARADALITAYDTAPGSATEAERFALLQQAERLLTTTPTSPRPATPGALRSIVATVRSSYATRLGELRGLAGTTAPTLSGLLAAVRPLLPLTGFDPQDLDLTPFEDRIIANATDLLARASGVRATVEERIAAATARLAEHDTAAGAQARVDALVAATHDVLGADLPVLPEFSLTATRAAELGLAWAAGTSGELTAHLTDRDFPVDDWLTGVARVREKVRDWERIVLLAGAVGRFEPGLVPVQLPHRPGDHWLALEYPDGYVIDGDRLLYTAHYADPLVAAGPLCGLLLDEWTEVIPATGETTGLTFNYDAPNSEPPQVMLLATPPTFRGAWRWDDIVATLHETLDLAATRAVEPAQLDDTAYAQFLPATVTAATARGISIATNFARVNNAVFRERR